MDRRTPDRGGPSVIQATAPKRVCDNGGWTDTGFAGHGLVFNIAVTPVAHATVRLSPPHGSAGRLTIHARNFGDRYAWSPRAGRWAKHPLIEAAIVTTGVPDRATVDVEVWSKG